MARMRSVVASSFSTTFACPLVTIWWFILRFFCASSGDFCPLENIQWFPTRVLCYLPIFVWFSGFACRPSASVLVTSAFAVMRFPIVGSLCSVDIART